MDSQKCLDCGQRVADTDATCPKCGKKMSDQRTGQDRRDGDERRDDAEDAKAVDPERRARQRRQDDQNRRKFSY